MTRRATLPLLAALAAALPFPHQARAQEPQSPPATPGAGSAEGQNARDRQRSTLPP